MKRIISRALLAGGVLLLILGVSASKFFALGISPLFAASPTDKATWMMIGGLVLSVICLDRAHSERRRAR